MLFRSYLQGTLSTTVNKKQVKEPLSLVGVGTNLNGEHYYAYRNPYCNGFLKVTMKDYDERDFTASADAQTKVESKK